MSNDTSLLARAADEYPLSLADVAELVSKSERTVRRWTEVGRENRGLLNAAQTLNGLHFRVEDVEAYMRPRPVDRRRATNVDAAVAAGKAAGERLAQTPLTPSQRALLESVRASFQTIGGE